MRKWNETRITWDMRRDENGVSTDIPLADDTSNQLISRLLRARSLPDGSIEITISIVRSRITSDWVLGHAEQKAVEERVRRIPGYQDRMALRLWNLSKISFVATPQRGESFCEGAFK